MARPRSTRSRRAPEGPASRGWTGPLARHVEIVQAARFPRVDADRRASCSPAAPHMSQSARNDPGSRAPRGSRGLRRYGGPLSSGVRRIDRRGRAREDPSDTAGERRDGPPDCRGRLATTDVGVVDARGHHADSGARHPGRDRASSSPRVRAPTRHRADGAHATRRSPWGAGSHGTALGPPRARSHASDSPGPRLDDRPGPRGRDPDGSRPRRCLSDLALARASGLNAIAEVIRIEDPPNVSSELVPMDVHGYISGTPVRSITGTPVRSGPVAEASVRARLTPGASASGRRSCRGVRSRTSATRRSTGSARARPPRRRRPHRERRH